MSWTKYCAPVSKGRGPSVRFGALIMVIAFVIGCSDEHDVVSADDDAAVGLDSARLPLDEGEIDLGVDHPDNALASPDVDPLDGAVRADKGASDTGVSDSAFADVIPLDMSPDAALVPREGFTVDEIRVITSLGNPGPPLPNPTNRFADDPDVALLGQAFFFTDQLGPTFVDCTTCHSPRGAFSKILSYDGQGGLNFRSVPSLIGISSMPWFFWDGRADTLWGQTKTPLEHPDEMASDRLYIAHAIYNNPDFKQAYEASFGPMPPMDESDRFPPRGRPGWEDEPELTAPWLSMDEDDRVAINRVLANVGKAIEAFLRKLRFQDSTFDRYARGLITGEQVPLNLMPERAKEGLLVFIETGGCIHCHSGPLLSDGRFHNLGSGAHPEDDHARGRAMGVQEVLNSEFNAASVYSDDPDGPRARRLGNLQVGVFDEGAFRTPSLRNVTRTAPYGHDGRFRDLRAIIEYKVSPEDEPPGERDPLLEVVNLSDYEIDSLRAFLETLVSGRLPVDLTTPPELGR